ncbi:grpE protein [Salix suchowensis]|nr:grpE protein [Salix suchowensis]
MSPLHHMPLRLCKPSSAPFLSNSSPIPINNIKRRSLKAYLAPGDSAPTAIFYGDEKTILNIEAKVGTIEKENQELLQKVSSLSAEITSGKEKYIRLQADFDNFRRRSDKERVNIRSDAQGEVIESLLPMVDSFERAKQQIQPETKKETKNKMQKNILQTILRFFLSSHTILRFFFSHDFTIFRFLYGHFGTIFLRFYDPILRSDFSEPFPIRVKISILTALIDCPYKSLCFFFVLQDFFLPSFFLILL